MKDRYEGFNGPPRDIDDLEDWLNCWADLGKHPEHVQRGYTTPWGKGYRQAVSDIYAALRSLRISVRGEDD